MFLSYRYAHVSICVCCYRTDKTVLVSCVQWLPICLMFLSYRYARVFICVCCYRTDKTVLVSTGFHGDVLTLTKLIEARLKVAKFLSFFLLLCPIQYATVVQTQTFLIEWIDLLNCYLWIVDLISSHSVICRTLD